MDSGGYSVRYGIEQHGIKNVGRVFGTPSTPVLYEEIVRRREGLISHLGPIAGTEREMGGKPESTFSTCFGAPFMTLPPAVYAKLLRDKINKHKVNCWLLNTGLSGGSFGVGERIKIAHTRAMIRAILNNSLSNVPTRLDPIFNLHVPVSCEGIAHEIFDPRNTWRNPSDYDKVALDLASKFSTNFEKFAPDVSREVREAGPRAR